MRAYLFGIAAFLAASPAAAAVTISFSGSADGHNVTGFVRYDETQPVNVSASGIGYRTGFYYPSGPDYRLVFSTDGTFVNDGYVGIVGDGEPGNTAGYNDTIIFQLTRGGSGRESYGFSIAYPNTTLASTALPASPPPGAGSFSYSYAGRGYTIPVTWIAQAGLLPEPGSWALMIGGIGLIGTTLRQRSRPARAAA